MAMGAHRGIAGGRRLDTFSPPAHLLAGEIAMTDLTTCGPIPRSPLLERMDGARAESGGTSEIYAMPATAARAYGFIVPSRVIIYPDESVASRAEICAALRRLLKEFTP